MLQQLLGRCSQKRLEVADERLLERLGGAIVVEMSPSLGLFDDFLDDTHREQVTGGDLQLFGDLHLA